MRVWLLVILVLSFAALPAIGEDARTMRYTPRSADDARAWQENVREALFERLRLADLVRARSPSTRRS